MKRISSFICFLVLITVKLYGNYNPEFVYSGKTNLVLYPGLSYHGSNNFYGEFNCMLSKPFVGLLEHYDKGFFLGLEFSKNSKDYILAPKLGYETALIFVYRASIIPYYDSNDIDLRSLFEIGIGHMKHATVSYGYGLPLLKYQSQYTTEHRITVIYKLHRRLLGNKESSKN